MKELLRKTGIAAVVLSVLLLCSVSVSAAEIVDEGLCGDNATWMLDSEGILIIDGTGKVHDFSADSSYRPQWGK